jgi:23S rRNA (adenine2503-C2)-methyltransferase
MGMGEPLLNLDGVLRAVHIINSHLGIGARSLTISTVGVHKAISKLAQHQLQCTLAVSLHAPNQQLREKLVPSARTYPLDQLLRDTAGYFRKTRRRVTFEYTVLKGINDAPEHVRLLPLALNAV